jgi:hypothetical protein
MAQLLLPGAVIVAGLLAVAAISAGGSGEQASLEPPVPGLALPAPRAAAARPCAACGWIESRREDQYSVRMRDGTSRVFDEIPGVTWRLGERLIFID